MNKTEYHKYLASRDWAKLKNQVKNRSLGSCERCRDGEHSSTHHLTYERVGHENLSDLIGVCENCHKFLSANSDTDPCDKKISDINDSIEILFNIAELFNLVLNKLETDYYSIAYHDNEVMIEMLHYLNALVEYKAHLLEMKSNVKNPR
jgi:hypothetical protein